MSNAGRVGSFRPGDPHNPRGLLVPSPSPHPRRGKCFPAGELAALRSAEGRKSPRFPPVWRWIRACGLCVFLFFFLPSCAVFGTAGEVGSVFPGGFLGVVLPSGGRDAEGQEPLVAHSRRRTEERSEQNYGGVLREKLGVFK